MGTYASSAFQIEKLFPGAMDSCLPEASRSFTELDDIDALMRTYGGRLLRFIAYSTGDQDLAETITQDTLLRAYKARDRFRGECTVNTWLTGIAVNLIRDHQRTGRSKFWKHVQSTAVDVHELASSLAAEGSTPEVQLLAREKVKLITHILESLPHRQRTIFMMKFSEEMRVKDISEALGIPIPTVRTHLHRALKAIRTQVGARK